MLLQVLPLGHAADGRRHAPETYTDRYRCGPVPGLDRAELGDALPRRFGPNLLGFRSSGFGSALVRSLPGSGHQVLLSNENLGERYHPAHFAAR